MNRRRLSSSRTIFTYCWKRQFRLTNAGSRSNVSFATFSFVESSSQSVLLGPSSTAYCIVGSESRDTIMLSLRFFLAISSKYSRQKSLFLISGSPWFQRCIMSLASSIVFTVSSSSITVLPSRSSHLCVSVRQRPVCISPIHSRFRTHTFAPNITGSLVGVRSGNGP